MITERQFDKRAKELFRSRQAEVAARYWKSGNRAGQLRRAAEPLPFTYPVFELWLFRVVGLQAVLCPYCSAPIDVLTLSLDHRAPKSRGGSIDLDNLQAVCAPCNLRKGDFTHEEYVTLLNLLSPPEYSYLRREMLKRLDAAARGSQQRFFRKPSAKQPAKAVMDAVSF